MLSRNIRPTSTAKSAVKPRFISNHFNLPNNMNLISGRSAKSAPMAHLLSTESNLNKAPASAADDEDHNRTAEITLEKSYKTTSKGTRRRMMRNSTGKTTDAEDIPCLTEFMHRAKVRKQYRNFVRLARFIDDADNKATGECRAALEEVRLSFKLSMKKTTDSLSKNMAYSEGERRLRELQSMVGYTSQRPSSLQQQYNHECYDKDSWINIKDEEDPRGRVGVHWPWEQNNDDNNDGSGSNK